MPSTSAKQAHFMAMCSSTTVRRKMKGKCPPLKVAREFSSADKAKRRASQNKYISY